jgi:hypothetical protein
MKYEITGKNTSEAQVVDISPLGIWLNVNAVEYFLPYSEFPWFKQARVEDVFDVRIEGKDHLRWEALDVDLSLESIENPSMHPMVYEPKRGYGAQDTGPDRSKE